MTQTFPGPYWLWPVLCICFLCGFFLAVMLVALAIQHRRGLMCAAASLLAALCFVLVQGVIMGLFSVEDVPWWETRVPGMMQRAVLALMSPGGWALLPLAVGLLALEGALFRGYLIFGRTRITPMSIKEAMDSLPMGACYYLPGGRIVMANRGMEDFCRAAVGEALINGETFSARLFGENAPQRDSTLVTLPDGKAWSVTRKSVPHERATLTLLLASDVTEEHRKTEALEAAQRSLADLGERLVRYNRDLTDYIAQSEALQARMRIHDELGLSLLAIRHCLLNHEDEAAQREVVDRLRQNIRFLQANSPAPEAQDEYALMIGNAEKLGVRILVEGTLPQLPHVKHVLAVAIHECFTNTLRHAHGDELRIAVREEETRFVAVLTNNGEQPAGEIRETGGLGNLRRLAGSVGGTMTVRSLPAFSITLELPKEDAYAL